MSLEKPTDDDVWNSINSDKKVICPNCDNEAFRYIPVGCNSDIDTIGSVTICATNKGTYLH